MDCWIAGFEGRRRPEIRPENHLTLNAHNFVTTQRNQVRYENKSCSSRRDEENGTSPDVQIAVVWPENASKATEVAGNCVRFKWGITSSILNEIGWNKEESCSTKRDEEIDTLHAGQLAVVWPEISSKVTGVRQEKRVCSPLLETEEKPRN